MGKLVRILLTIAVGLVLFEAAILKFIIPEQPAWEEFEGEGFTCQVPVANYDYFEEDDWHKNRFWGKAGDIYVSTAEFEGDPMAAIRRLERFVHQDYETEVEVFGPGKFYLETFGKGRRYIYIFAAGPRLFWAETAVRGSSLRFYKDVLDHVVESLVIDGAEIAPGFSRSVERINAEIVWYSQSIRVLAIFMFALPIVILAVVSIPVVSLVGRLPEFSGERPVMSAANLFAWVRHPLGLQGTLVAMALFEDRLEIYSWRRQFLSVRRSGDGTVSEVPGKDKIVVVHGKRRATVEVEHPKRWIDEIRARGIPVKP